MDSIRYKGSGYKLKTLFDLLASWGSRLSLLTTGQKGIIKRFYGVAEDEYIPLLESLATFVEQEVLPTAGKIDKDEVFPRENLTKLFDQGFTAMSFPKEYGGLGLPSPIYMAAMELVAKACASTALSISIHGTVCEGIRSFGSDRLKEDYLRPLIKGEKLAAFALTEAGSGSDAEAMRTSVTARGDAYVLNGSKMFITNAGQADVYFVFARSDKGTSSFIVDKETKGLKVGRRIGKLGVRGSPLGELLLEDCEVPKVKLVGAEGEGFKYAKGMLNGGRISIAAISVGIAQIAYEKCLDYSKTRSQFGRPIADFQMTREKVANMITEINAARLLTYYAASLKDGGVEFTSEAAQAKIYGSEMALRICNEAIQIHGGYGYTDESDIHRHWRDAKLMTIGEGTSEVMKLIISKSELGVPSSP